MLVADTRGERGAKTSVEREAGGLAPWPNSLAWFTRYSK